MKIESPYKNIEQNTKIILEPYQMNSDIRNHLKFNLIKKIEKKCNSYGYIDTVHKITKFSDGIMYPENLSGNVIYDITYLCKICIPIENSVIIGQIKVINFELVFAVNGPIMIFITRNNIDSTFWDVSNNLTFKNTNTKLNIGDYVKIQIINKRINEGDTQIKTIGKLLDIPTEKEIEKYFGSIIENVEEIESNFI